MQELGLEPDNNIILRRTLGIDGKSRAWINDVPVSIKALKTIGDELVEIHGQFANHALLNQSNHRMFLDEFGVKNINGFNELLTAVNNAYNEYHTALKKFTETKDFLDRNSAEQDYLLHNITELRELNVQPGEEGTLASKRNEIINAQKNIEILSDALNTLSPNGSSLDSVLFSAAHILERIKGEENPYSKQIDDLYNAADIVSNVAAALAPTDIDTDSVDVMEERLFAIRAAARKHRVTADELPAKLAEMESQLNVINNSDEELRRLDMIVKQTKKAYDDIATKLTNARQLASEELRKQILQELPDLKLGNADFIVEISATTASSTGQDNIVFMIKTNPGMPFAPLHKAASGGELARLMLVLRVVFAGQSVNRTFVFDEIDTGISGATASAVGERLKRLAHNAQALVITHSAQVAGYGDKHFKIEKSSKDDTTITQVYELTDDARLNEIARIISGAQITQESLATARTLLH